MKRLCYTDDTPQNERYYYVRAELFNISLDSLHSQGACCLTGLQYILDNVPTDAWSDTLQPAVVKVCSAAASHPTPTCLAFYANSWCARVQFIVEHKTYFEEYMHAASNPLTWERTHLHAKRWVDFLRAKPVGVQPTVKGKASADRPTSTGKAKPCKPKLRRKEIAGRPASKATAKKKTTSIVPLAARVAAEAAAAVAAETETARLVAVTEAEATPAEQARLAAEAAAAAAEAVPTPQKRRQRRPAKKPELMMVSSAEHYEKAPTFECLLRWMTDDQKRLVEHFADRCPRSTQTLPKRSARSMVRVSLP